MLLPSVAGEVMMTKPLYLAGSRAVAGHRQRRGRQYLHYHQRICPITACAVAGESKDFTVDLDG